MPSHVCDTRPCDQMKKALQTFIAKDGEDDILMIRVDTPNVIVEVLLEYCPFCGTRIDGKWAKEMKGAYQ